MKVKLKADLIRDYLAKRHLPQNWLAGVLSTTSGYMSQLMRGIRTPSPKMRQKIQNIFQDFKFDDLFEILQSQRKKNGRR